PGPPRRPRRHRGRRLARPAGVRRRRARRRRRVPHRCGPHRRGAGRRRAAGRGRGHAVRSLVRHGPRDRCRRRGCRHARQAPPRGDHTSRHGPRPRARGEPAVNGLHICFFTDQHPDTLGGAQESVQLQRTFLERAGHTVTIVAPRSPVVPAAVPDVVALPDPDVVALPGPTVARGQYTAALPGRRLDALVDRELAARGAVDVVHLQGDFWGAWLGKRFAARHGLPVVLTTRTNVDASFRAVAGPLAGIGLGAVAAWQRAVTGHLTARPARRSGLGAGYDYL